MNIKNEYNRIIANSDGRTVGDNYRELLTDEILEETGLLEKLKKADETREEDIAKQVDYEKIKIETEKEKEERLKQEFEGEFEVISPDGEVITIKNEW